MKEQLKQMCGVTVDVMHVKHRWAFLLLYIDLADAAAHVALHFTEAALTHHRGAVKLSSDTVTNEIVLGVLPAP